MNEALIVNYNAKVRRDSLCYILGDVGFGDLEPILKRLNGEKILIVGSHDKDALKFARYFKKIEHLLDIVIEDQPITLCHYAMRVWPRSHFNSWHLYGHCLDLQTEILTKTGWKKRSELNKSDLIATLNLKTSFLEYNRIKQIIDYKNYTGDVFHIRSKGTDLRVTNRHILIALSRRLQQDSIYEKFYANDYCKLSRRNFIKSGLMLCREIDLNDNYIRLLVWIAADGSLLNSSLIRVRVYKKRKVYRIRKLLQNLKISFRALRQKDNSISFNFSFPSYLKKYSIKSLDKKFQYVNKHQLKILINEYAHTDGHKYGKNKDVICIYTSKKIEADTIQTACILNEHQCNITTSEHHGFSKKPHYSLTITDGRYRRVANTHKSFKIENVYNEHMWCLRVKNETLFVRRNGKPIIVGNSHGRLESFGKSFDVGVDANNFFPLSLEEVKEKMNKLPDNFNLIKKE